MKGFLGRNMLANKKSMSYYILKHHYVEAMGNWKCDFQFIFVRWFHKRICYASDYFMSALTSTKKWEETQHVAYGTSTRY